LMSHPGGCQPVEVFHPGRDLFRKSGAAHAADPTGESGAERGFDGSRAVDALLSQGAKVALLQGDSVEIE
jgi:hypothetical protein